MHNLFLLPLIFLGRLIALPFLMVELLLSLMLAVALEWLWQRRVEPVASISGHLLAALDFVEEWVERDSLWAMFLIAPPLLTYVVVGFAGVCLLVLIEWLCWLALLAPRSFSGVLGWWHKALLALFSYGLRPLPDRGQTQAAHKQSRSH